jgi:paraquat-inducible protein B
MSRKARERLLQQLREQVERFSPDEESLTRAEVQDALREAGSDPEELREWLNATARQLANTQRAKGRPAPDYLQQAIDLSSPPDQLPRDEKTALQKAREWIQSMTAGPGKLSDDVEIIRAYRSRGDLSEEDQRVLDAAEEQLRDQIKKQSDG